MRCGYCEGPMIGQHPAARYCSPRCQAEGRAARTNSRRNNGVGAGLRFQVLRRDDFACVYCGACPSDGVKLHVDHVTPRAAGGKDIIGNLVTSCAECNLGKNDDPSITADFSDGTVVMTATVKETQQLS